MSLFLLLGRVGFFNMEAPFTFWKFLLVMSVFLINFFYSAISVAHLDLHNRIIYFLTLRSYLPSFWTFLSLLIRMLPLSTQISLHPYKEQHLAHAFRELIHMLSYFPLSYSNLAKDGNNILNFSSCAVFFPSKFSLFWSDFYIVDILWDSAVVSLII